MIVVLLPAYNEAQALEPLLESLHEVMEESHMSYRVVVINDGSVDETAAVCRRFAASMPVELINHPENRGLSEAIKTGLLSTLPTCRPNDVLVTMDSDNTHAPGLILRMVRLIREGHDVVIASRYRPSALVRGVPWSRRFLSWGGSWLFRLILPIHGVRDYTCGYRAYRVGTLQKAFEHYGDSFISQSGFSCMVDILIKLRGFDPIVTEVPLILRYDLKPGKSKMNVQRTIRETLSLLLRRRLGLDEKRPAADQVQPRP